MYIVVEIKKNNGVLNVTTTSHVNKAEARAKYYEILSEASKSGLEKHSASILNEKGPSLQNEGFENPQEVTENED